MLVISGSDYVEKEDQEKNIRKPSLLPYAFAK